MATPTYNPLSNYTRNPNTLTRGDDLYWNNGFTEAQCALACDGIPECKNYLIETAMGSGGTGKCYLMGQDATVRSTSDAGWISATKKADAPSSKYTGAQTDIATAVRYGGRNQDAWNGGGNCGGFNSQGEWNGRRLEGFGASYNGQCPSKFILSYCPKIGRPVDGSYVNLDGTVCQSYGPGCSGGDMATRLLRKCKYASIDIAQFINADGTFNESKAATLLEPASWKQVKLEYCSASIQNLDSSGCKNFFSDSSSAGPGISWYAPKLALCDGQGGHGAPNFPSCVTSINDVLKTTTTIDAVNRSTATGLVQSYCDANPQDSLCSCYNVTKYASRCISDASLQSLPGCSTLKSDFGDLPNYASVIIADKFCSSSDCITNALSSGKALMPVARSPQQTCPPIQACIQDFRNANLSGASVSAECKQTLHMTNSGGGGDGGGSGGAGGGGSGGAGGGGDGGSGGGPSPASGNLSLFVWVGVIAAVICCFLMILGIISIGD